MRILSAIIGIILLLSAAFGAEDNSQAGLSDSQATMLTKPYDGPYQGETLREAYFEPYLLVNGEMLEPLAGNNEDLTITLCDNGQVWSLLKEYTPWIDVNRFGVYTDLGTGNNQTLIFSGGHSEGYVDTTFFPASTSVGLWLLNDINNDSTFNGNDSHLFSEILLSAGTSILHQWFMVYDVSAYIGTGASYEFICPTEDFAFNGNFDYLIFIDDNHTSANFDHNDMIVGMLCKNDPPEAVCPGPTAVTICESGPIGIAGFSASDPNGNLVSITVNPGHFSGDTAWFTPPTPGTYVLTLIATDTYGAADTCQTIVTVTFNRAPVCIVPADTLIELCAPTPICLPISATDPDGNLSGCEITEGPGVIADGQWCYTPPGNETVSVTIRCTDECGAFCEAAFQVEFEMFQSWAMITIDRTGSMALTNLQDQTRLERARAMAHQDIDKLLDPNDPNYPGLYRIAILYFNAGSGLVLAQDFTSDGNILHAAVEAIPAPRHDTPLAAAMCESHCRLPHFPGCVNYMFIYTDGFENASQNFDMCSLCDPCEQYIPTGWNYDCDPQNPSGCTEWQICLFNQFASSGVNIVHYFGQPIYPFDKSLSGQGLEDLHFLRATALESMGEFTYHSDSETICGDANYDGDLDVSDGLYIINYVFISGPAPTQASAADVNCDGTTDVSDAVFIINHVFIGSSSPCDVNGDGIPDC